MSEDEVGRCKRGLTRSLGGAGARRCRPWTEAGTGPRQRPWKTESFTQGSFRRIKKQWYTKGESNANSRHQDPHSSVFCFQLFVFFHYYFFPSLTLPLFPPHCCFLVCFPSALLWLSPSATATFKGSAVTRRLWVPFEILTYMLSGCRQEWLTGPSQSNTGLGRLAVFCQRQPRRSNKGKGAEEERTHINKTKLLLPISQ